jgi:putative spermidine/putrescine transport system substrate-binding protein
MSPKGEEPSKRSMSPKGEEPSKRSMSRRRFLKDVGVATGALIAAPYVARRAAAATTQIVEVGWGGDYQFKHLNQAFAAPFTKETGIAVRQVASPGNMVGTIKAQVENKNPEWDVVAVTPPEGLVLKKQGLLAELTYDDDLKADYPAALLDKHLGPRMYSSNVLTWNTKHFADRQPKTWADLWDVKRFPGPRVLPAWFPWVNVEMALMASGVPKDQVYPLSDEKVRRGLDKLKELRPHVHVFYNAGAQSVQLFADGEVVFGMLYENRVREAVKRNVPIGWTLDGGIMELGYYVVPASSRNKEAANKFINVAMRRRSQAELVKINQYGATNPKAYDLLAPAERDTNLGYSPNLARQLRLDAAYWLEAGPKYTEAWDSLKAGK